MTDERRPPKSLDQIFRERADHTLARCITAIDLIEVEGLSDQARFNIELALLLRVSVGLAKGGLKHDGPGEVIATIREMWGVSHDDAS